MGREGARTSFHCRVSRAFRLDPFQQTRITAATSESRTALLYVTCLAGSCRNVVPARRQGYSPFDRANQVWPEDADEVMTQLNKIDETSGEAGGLIAHGFRRISRDSSAGLPPLSPHLPGTTTPGRHSMEGNVSPRASSGSLHSSGRRSLSSYSKDECAPGGKVQDYVHLILHLMRSIHALAMTKAGADVSLTRTGID